MRTAVHRVVVELRMLASPLEIRSSPHPIATQGMTALVTAMIANPITLPLQPGPNSGFRSASTITASATKPDIERKRSIAVGLMSCTASLIRRNDTPQIKASPINDAYASRRALESDTSRPVVGGHDQGHRPVVIDAHAHERAKAASLRLYSSFAKLLNELFVQLGGARRISCFEQARPAAAAHVGKQGELRNDQRRSADIDKAQGHL